MKSISGTIAAEELSNIASELAKYGLQLPAFSKIGGILANECSADEAAGRAGLCPRVGWGSMMGATGVGPGTSSLGRGYSQLCSGLGPFCLLDRAVCATPPSPRSYPGHQ